MGLGNSKKPLGDERELDTTVVEKGKPGITDGHWFR